jgi:hypothetical protein
MEAIAAVIAVHGAVDAAGGAADVASVEANAAAIVGESAPSAVRQRRRHRGPLALPPDTNRSCYPESRSQSTNAIRRHRFKKPIQPRQSKKVRQKLLLKLWLLSPRLFQKTNRSLPARRVPSLSTRSTKKSVPQQKSQSIQLRLR